MCLIYGCIKFLGFGNWGKLFITKNCFHLFVHDVFSNLLILIFSSGADPECSGESKEVCCAFVGESKKHLRRIWSKALPFRLFLSSIWDGYFPIAPRSHMSLYILGYRNTRGSYFGLRIGIFLVCEK